MMKYIRIFVACLLLATAIHANAQTDTKPLTIGQSTVLFSKILNENRNINIYLPEGYNAADTTTYPVIYILDGGMEEDFFHIAGIVRFNTQPWVARFPKSIVVGIENVNRRRDFTFEVPNLDFLEKEGFQKSSFPQYGKSAAYMDFLEKELQPFVKQNFHARAYNTVIGESLAGLLSTEILLKRPYLFNDYIIISPSLWWGERKLLADAANLMQKNLKKPVRVYLGVPNKDEDLRMYNVAVSLHEIAAKQKNISIIFDYMPEELHSTAIHQGVYNGFKKLFPKTAFSK
ncbi:alpha/beta hydrolase [Chitinophaga sp. Cy-1792]|uniref:alpha/beta hydrolase n=1 Tax=Chitinophaga sp. Cy-1792 TaxID=2608339 RepID=UPI00141F7172|nr:alpha/beta hydrolase-fold protein [Chitinophaga sp. Cy-1792]NIG55543.1 alpha/beta hydrolase [Chitinophaga sp. Cy-1792]